MPLKVGSPAADRPSLGSRPRHPRPGHWYGIVSEGLWHTVRNDDEGRMMALWFTVSGMAFIGLGLLARRSVTTTGALPSELRWILLALGTPVSLLEPVSGGWSLIAIGLLAVLTSRRDRRAKTGIAGRRSGAG
ncbi:DUF6463 family protein [Streptomyces sp. enrichment culture]|uniref:DUF6463 family protein n=1 Tax=Streptomyces sp. enrichment culture TaxID=1795815 RepID=UPI003F557736